MTDFDKNIRTLIRTLLAMPANSVRPADQNAPTGTVSQQYATVKVIYQDATGSDEIRLANAASNNVTETIIGQRLLLASVNFYKGDAIAKARRLVTLLGSTQAIQLMQQLGLGLVRTTQVRDLTALVDTKWEERGQLDIEFHAIAQEDLTLATYGTVQVSIATADANGTTTTQAFEVIEP